MSGAEGVAQRYRFPPLVRAGLFGSMHPTQIGVLLAGGGLTFIGLLFRLVPYALIPVTAAAVVAFKRHRGWPLHEWLTMRGRWWRQRRRRRDRWLRPIPLIGATPDQRPAIPPVMHGLALVETPAGWVRAISGRFAGIGVVHDRVAHTITGVLRVTGDGQFSLLAGADQDHRVGGWGDALSGFCRENTPVTQIVWHEWATTSPLGTDNQHLTPLHADTPVEVTAARAAYVELIERSAPKVTVHDTVVTITVDLSVTAKRRLNGRSTLTAGLDILVEELRLFTHRLEAAGLTVDAPLTPAEITRTVRSRSHPPATGPLRVLHRTLAAAAGVAPSITDAGPMAVIEEFDRVQIDGSWHRSWWVEGWPRLEVPAGWMDLLLTTTGMTRTYTIVFEPVAPSAAVRSIDEAAVALESAANAKAKRGFRIRAADRRARDEIDRREQELVAGYGDLAYAGLITISASTSPQLDDAANDIEQCAAHAGLQLRALESRHATAWLASLPLGRNITRRTHPQ